MTTYALAYPLCVACIRAFKGHGDRLGKAVTITGGEALCWYHLSDYLSVDDDEDTQEQADG